jgi:outer membrane protein TolC
MRDDRRATRSSEPLPRSVAGVFAAAALLVSPAALAAPEPLGVDDCVRIALGSSAEIGQAEARVHQWEARLAEVESLYDPKLAALAFIAPMYTVRGGALDYDIRWKSLRDWGPYTHLQATLALPFYSFGRVEAGERAASARAAVERARAREVRNTVALEVKRFYYARLLALSMLPALKNGEGTVKKAIDYAERAFAEGTGEATTTDIAKLHYAQAEVEKVLLIAESGAKLAAAALKHTMGLEDDAPVTFAGDTLPELPNTPEQGLAEAILEASKGRPEWAEVTEGKTAALALAQAERLANAPMVLLGGTLTGDWAPTRQHSPNPYLSDSYNQILGGVALGLQFNLDPALAHAKAQGATATGEEVDELARFAKTGIPLQVKKAHQAVLDSRKLVGISDRSVAATKKWLTFAAAAFTTGTGDARDVLEGLAAYVQARRGYFESLEGYFVARAELEYAMGRS